MVGAAVLLFFSLRWAGLALQHRRKGQAVRRRLGMALEARMNRLADAVLHPDPPESPAEAQLQADAAKRYVLTLDLLGTR
jgi:hypothetical protein